MGSSEILEAGENGKFDSPELKEKIDYLLKKSFKPEFLNRIDEIVMFNRLEKSVISGIVRIQLEKVCERLAERRIKLTFDDSAVNFLCDAGYDQNFGARPVKRAIQNYVENPLAKEILSGKFGENAQIKLTLGSDGNLDFV